MRKKILLFSFLSIITVLSFSLVAIAQSNGNTARVTILSETNSDTTEQAFKGIVHTHRIASLPRVNNMHILNVDLSDADISFLATPYNPTDGYPGSETKLQTTYDFAAQHNVQVAINATPFYDLNGGVYTSGDPADVRGLAASQGTVYSDYMVDYPALITDTADLAYIVNAYDPQPSINNAVGGFSRILTNGVKTPCTDIRCTAVHP
ncbi:MAG: hypothetical protein PHI63_01450, partial [Patescibacteria group bacterium]|nr:hypothetical protein [Patescibacteria group bacterium]